MISEIKEKIKVGVIFDNGLIKIKWFIWKNRKIEVKRITYKWKLENGENEIYNFAVTDGVNIFEISFNSKNFVWTLEKIYIT